MIEYNSLKLKNGLTVISDYMTDTPLATFSIGYKVGSKYENPDLTGLAHLFEHIMFGGSKNIKHFDQVVDMAGGSNNAFTTSDYTNYYMTLPAANIETAFYLESDRMFYPNLSEHTLEIQRKVVVEEFKQRVFNPPYGDLMTNLLPLAYQISSYKWPVIGADIDHIKKADLSDIRKFHTDFYHPSNAVIAVSGNVKPEVVFRLAEKWFGNDNNFDKTEFQNHELKQTKPREKVILKDVPLDMITLAYHMGKRDSRDFYCGDLLSDVLSFDRSSRFQKYLKQRNSVFTTLSASITGSIDHGLFIIKGKLNNGFSVDHGIEVIESQLRRLLDELSDEEIKKVINKLITYQKVGHLEHSNRAMDLCYADIVREPDYINEQFEQYQKTTKEEVREFAVSLFNPDNRNMLIYKREK
jgi:predicted Zn-dependent peptidase